MTKSIATPYEKIALKVIDSWLDYRIRHTSIPGVQVCIRKKGEIIFSKAYGVANVETGRKLKTTDMHHIASHSKMFTACALLILQEQGKLKLADKIIDYIPELKKHKDKRFKDITVRDLLSNRAGIFKDGVDCEFWRLQEPFMDKKRLIAEILSSHLILEPGTETKYSNVGFSLFGLIIEQVTGQSYEDAVKTLILKKLKTKDLLPDYDAKSGHSYADGHSRIFHNQPRKVLKHPMANAMAAATGFCGTADAASLFLYEYLFGSSLISPKTQKELKTLFWTVYNTPKQSYGLGLHKNQINNHTVMGHSGGFPGYLSQTRHIQGTDYIISVIVNVTEMVHTNIMTSCIDLLQKISSYFKQEKADDLVISPIMMTNWGGSIGIVGKEKALRFFCNSWQVVDDAVELQKVAGNAFICDRESGNDFFGEHHVFSYAKNGRINGLKVGGARIYLEKDFFEKKEKNMLA